MAGDAIRGRCSCGAVEYAVIGPPIVVHCCHCSACQRESGTAFALNAMIEADRVAVTKGRIERVPTPSDGGKGQMVARCPHCGIALWSNYLLSGEGLRFVRVGTLDDRAGFAPDIHVYTRSRQPWVVLPPDAVAFEGMYDFKAVLPADRLQRLRAAFTR